MQHNDSSLKNGKKSKILDGRTGVGENISMSVYENKY